MGESSMEAARASAEASGASADAAVGLFHLEQERWQRDQVRAASAEHWSAHVMPSGVRTAAKVVRTYNRGPGAANVQGVAVEVENAGDPGIQIERSPSDAVTPPIRSSTFFVPRTINTTPVSRTATVGVFATVSDGRAAAAAASTGRGRTRVDAECAILTDTGGHPRSLENRH